MKAAAAVLTPIVTSAVLSFAEGSKTFVGVITDTLCAGNHAAMKVTPEAKCVKEGVRDGKTFQYALVARAIARQSRICGGRPGTTWLRFHSLPVC